MYIKSITLRDWKAYTSANFEFPAPLPDKNIILIGAPNGYGKTSLFEAIVLGLFGRNGLPLVARSPFSSDEQERLATSYKNFLEKALYRGAIDAGRTSCSVKLTFVDEGEEIEIQRIWHFSERGQFKPLDEEVRVYEGVTRKVIGPSASDDSDELEWFRDYIARRFLPYYLAAFFLLMGNRSVPSLSVRWRHKCAPVLKCCLVSPFFVILQTTCEAILACEKAKSAMYPTGLSTDWKPKLTL